jgi:hypothetical protein
MQQGPFSTAFRKRLLSLLVVRLFTACRQYRGAGRSLFCSLTVVRNEILILRAEVRSQPQPP